MTNHLPAVHLNGSGRKALTEPLDSAAADLFALADTLKGTAPHMRDFYTRPDGSAAFEAAVAVHWARIELLQVVANSLMSDAYCNKGVSDHPRNTDRALEAADTVLKAYGAIKETL